MLQGRQSCSCSTQQLLATDALAWQWGPVLGGLPQKAKQHYYVPGKRSSSICNLQVSRAAALMPLWPRPITLIASASGCAGPEGLWSCCCGEGWGGFCSAKRRLVSILSFLQVAGSGVCLW